VIAFLQGCRADVKAGVRGLAVGPLCRIGGLFFELNIIYIVFY